MTSGPKYELFQLPPIDAQGPFRESLSSVVIRTARAHDLSPSQLLTKKFHYIGRLGTVSYAARVIGFTVGQTLNGPGPVGAALVKRFEVLTGLTGMTASTTRGLSSFTTHNGMLRRNLAWSPEVLESSPEPYHPLLWMFDAVRVCPVARKPLVASCCHCKNTIPMLPASGYINRCWRCGADMATNVKRYQADPIAQLVKDIEYEVWMANQIGACVQEVAKGTLLCPHGFVDSLNFWTSRFELKRTSSIAKALGCSGSSVSNWMSDKSVPRLRMTVNIAWVFGVGLVEFLNKVIPPGHSGRLQAPREPFTRYVETSRRRPIDRQKMEDELREIIRENRFPMLSFREICEQKLKRGATIVRDYFPELSKELARRNLGNRRLRAQVERNQYCESIRTYAKLLHERGIVPNHKTLAHFIDHPTRLRCGWAIEALGQIRLELGYETNDEQLELPL